MKKYELHSGILAYQDFMDILSNISEVLKEICPEEMLHVRYGWGCNIHHDLQHVPMRVGTNWIKEFINDSMTRKIFVPGESDLMLEDDKTEIEFCHESDIRICAETREELEIIKESKLLKKYLMNSTIQEVAAIST